MIVLVTGGGGYIGSHMVKALVSGGIQVVTVDNLSTGHAEAIKYGTFEQGDLEDREFLDHIFSKYSFDCVLHFAAASIVAESIVKPDLYYRNNVVNTINLLDAMKSSDCTNIVFSSTAAVFGSPADSPISEISEISPINPYGMSKAMVETILRDYCTAHSLNAVSLRYFNAAGADPGGEIGERHDPETHLIPLALQTASGRRSDTFKIYGDDYDTIDGTCIRDYIHVCDLAEAHLCAMTYLLEGAKGFSSFNLGNGSGFSVKQILSIASSVVSLDGFELSYEIVGRRLGDPPVLVSDSSLAKEYLCWEPKHTDIRKIIEDAWAWEKKLMNE